MIDVPELSPLDRADASLSAAAAATVADALVPRDRSLPVALARVAAACGAGADRSTVERVETAVAAFEGYVRLRAASLDPTAERDVAVLASDYLHARAYEAIGGASVACPRRLALYRVLIDGSDALARRFFERSAAESTTDDASSAAALAGVAGELGATAAGASRETATAFGRYGRALATALDRVPSPGPRDAVVRALSGAEPPDGADGADRTRRASRPDPNLDRLGAALDALVAADAVDPRVRRRLERATRITTERGYRDDG
ncbi:hypothetical protein [Salinilacihabitans rarus]|uniref:hypothetical protein n=1 Tax=Salinilacihabitans rarus TaxID=2961596 RepID=UPI0020C85013|nr:hypothetical protein [Salinilacihabitans rarus]